MKMIIHLRGLWISSFRILPTVEYKKQKPIRNDTDFLNNLDGLLD